MTQLQKVFNSLKSGEPKTPEQISKETGIESKESVKARIRDLRKAGHTVQLSKVNGYLFKYTLTPTAKTA